MNSVVLACAVTTVLGVVPVQAPPSPPPFVLPKRPLPDTAEPKAMAVLEAAQKALDHAKSIAATVEQTTTNPPTDGRQTPRRTRVRVAVRAMKPNFAEQRITTEWQSGEGDAEWTRRPGEETVYASDGTILHSSHRQGSEETGFRDSHHRIPLRPDGMGPTPMPGIYSEPLRGFFRRQEGAAAQIDSLARHGVVKSVRLAGRETFEGVECDVVETTSERSRSGRQPETVRFRYLIAVKDRLIRRIVETATEASPAADGEKPAGRTVETVMRDVRLDPPLRPEDFAFTLPAAVPAKGGASPFRQRFGAPRVP